LIGLVLPSVGPTVSESATPFNRAQRASVGSNDASDDARDLGRKPTEVKRWTRRATSESSPIGGARNVLRDDDGRQYLFDDAERVSRIGIVPNREHDQPVVVAGSPS
jgi:hypothetical protein